MKKPYLVIIFCALLLATLSISFLGNTSLNNLGIMPSSMSRSSSSMDGGFAMPMGDVASEKMMIAPDYPMPGIGGGSDAMMVTDRAVQYNSYHSLIVNDVSSYTKNIREFITSVNGQVLSSSQGKNEQYDYASLYAKVPVASFDQTTQKITENTKKIINESISTADRTGEVVNNIDQTETLKAEIAVKEAQLEETNVQSEKTRIQNEINILQRRLTSFEQQAENIQQQVEYATIQVTVANNESYFNPYAQGNFIEEFKQALRSLKGAFYGLMTIAIWAAVYSVILIPAYLIVKWVKNRFSQPKLS